MEAKQIELYKGENVRTMLVGDHTMVFANVYDVNQLWFPFMVGTSFPILVDEEPPKQKQLVPNAKYARLPPECMRPYTFEKGVEQEVLPFHEHRRITNKVYNAIMAVGFPTWDRIDGQLCTLTWPGDMNKKQEVQRWCEANCNSLFFVSNKGAIFKSRHDWIIARLAI